MFLNDKIVYSPLFSREIADAGMLIAQFDGPPSWSIDASETLPMGRGGGINSVGWRGGKNFRPPCPPPPLPTGILYSPQFRLHQGDQDGGPPNSMVDIYDLTEK